MGDEIPAPRPGPVVRKLTAQLLLASTAFALHHCWLVWLMSSGARLGALYDRKFAPLYAGLGLEVKPGWLLLGAVAVAACAVVSLVVLLDRGCSLRRALAVTSTLFVVVCISVSMIDGFVPSAQGDLPAFLEPFSQQGHEYYGDVPKVAKSGGVGDFLRKFSRPAMGDRLALHSGTHPPGPILFLWLASQPFGRSLGVTSLAAVLFTTLTVVGGFFIAREVYGDATARYALCLLLLTPSLVWFTATSMDGPMSVFPVAAVWLYLRGTGSTSPSGWHALALGTAMALASFMTYASAVVALLFAVDVVWSAREGRSAVVRRIVLLATGAAVSVGAYVLLWLTTGYDPFAALAMALANDARMMGTGVETGARYLNISLANLSAFLFGVGLPTTVLWIRALGDRITARGAAARRFETAFATTLVISAFSSLFTLEVERVWLFLAPLVVAPAAHHLRRLSDSSGSRAPLYWAAAALALQLVVGEALLGTRW